MKSDEVEKSIAFLQKSLESGTKFLGRGHPLTAELNVDVARSLLKLDHREEAINFLEKAYQIYSTAGSKHSLNKADIANQMATLFSEFNCHKEAIQFAELSNSVYSEKGIKHILEILNNTKIIAESKTRLGDFDGAIQSADTLYNTVTNSLVWSPDLGEFLTGSILITFEVLMKQQFAEIKNRVFFILDMIDESMRRNGEIRLASTKEIESLKFICENNKNPSSFLRSILSDVKDRDKIYTVDNLVNVTIKDFLVNLQSYASGDKHSIHIVESIVKSLYLMFKCVGGDKLMKILKPVT